MTPILQTILAEILQGITLVKMVVAVLMVVGLSVLATSLAIFIAAGLFRRLESVRIDKPLRLNTPQLILRALFSAAVIILITASAGFLGSDWAGLLSAFPMTMLPFVFIIHATYRAEHVWAVIKNVPRGVGAIVV